MSRRDPPGRIVVGLDGSDASRVALRWAMAECAVHGAVLEVLHAWRNPMVFVPNAYSADLAEMGRMGDAAMDFLAHELDAVGADAATGLAIERTQIEGSAAHALVDASRRAQLVVVGRRGTGRFPHELISPKAVQVAHHASCPVAVVPDTWAGTGRGVVVGVDGSEPSAAGMRWAVDEAGGRHASITAVMAWGLLDQHHLPGAETFDPQYDDKDAQAALDAFVDATLDADGTAVARIVVNDLPARALLDQAGNAELLVVGARGLGGFQGLLLGSVSQRCLTHSACPTVVVR